MLCYLSRLQSHWTISVPETGTVLPMIARGLSAGSVTNGSSVTPDLVMSDWFRKMAALFVCFHYYQQFKSCNDLVRCCIPAVCEYALLTQCWRSTLSLCLTQEVQ